METLERLLYGIVVLFCILAVIAGVIFAFMWVCLDRSLPEYYPDDWGEYVWVSDEPKAFITQSIIRTTEKSTSFLGGQMEIDGEMQTINLMIYPGSYYIGAELQTYTVSAKTGRFVHSEERPQIVFSSKTKYKTDRIVCKIDRKNKYFAGQKIVFMRYDKDAVSPADFGFELESWDDFVTVVDSLPSDDDPDPEPERKPKPTPIPEEYPYPTPVPIATPTPNPAPQYAPVSADARPARQKTAICRVTS